MKIRFLIILSGLVFNLPVFSQTMVPLDNPKQWVEKQFAKGVVPPFSFVYGGKKSDSFIKNWQYKAEIISATEPDKEIYEYSYFDKTTGLLVKCTVTWFTDFSAVEWVLHFSNTSKKNTPIIEKVAVSDHSFKAGSNGTFTLHHAKGSNAGRGDFQPIDETMQVGKNIYMSPPGGRSSNTTAFPFFNIAMPGQQGMVVAVGWTGGWYADIVQTDAQTVSLKSGMEKMQLTLYPGEEIRTPKICLLYWEGEDRMIGHNRFRAFILAHHSRKINGQFAEYPLTGLLRLHEIEPCGEFECSTEESQLAIVRQHKLYDMMPEAFWLDAGWYDGCGWNKPNGSWWSNVGNWTPDKERFPNGLRPVADAIHEAGSKLMVWFEPERVYAQTFIHREHPEWLIGIEGSPNYLFNLGNTDARIWLTDHITEVIKKEGIDYYRQDFNMEPSPYWIANDKPGRIGMSEIRHIEGLYAFWDSLLVRFPNLLIDNCASGGRRIDLETTSRSGPLWRTDYSYFEPIGKQCHTYALNFFLPIHGTATTIDNDFTFRSGISATTTGYWLLGRGKETVPASRKYMQQFKELRPYFYGDYYPLTSTLNYTNNDVWLAYQLNRPKEKDGVILAYRRQDNQQSSIKINLSGLDNDAVYELYDEDTGIRNNHTGNELMNGLEIALSQPSTSLLIKYRKMDVFQKTPIPALVIDMRKYLPVNFSWAKSSVVSGYTLKFSLSPDFPEKATYSVDAGDVGDYAINEAGMLEIIHSLSPKAYELDVYWAVTPTVQNVSLNTQYRSFSLKGMEVGGYFRYDQTEWEVIGQSSALSPNEGKHIIDNNLATLWHTNHKSSTPHWLIIDMKTPQSIFKYDVLRNIYMPHGDTKTVELYIGDSPDASGTWKKIGQGAFKPVRSDTLLEILTTDNVTKGRYLKVQLPDSYRERPDAPYINIAKIYFYYK